MANGIFRSQRVLHKLEWKVKMNKIKCNKDVYKCMYFCWKIKLYKSSMKETCTNISIEMVGGEPLIYYKLILS